MIKERISQLLDYKGIPKENFYKKIGMTSANFRGSAQKRPINSNAIVNILSEIPDLNPDWLLTGKGEMIKKEPTSEKFVPFDDTKIKALEDEISRLKDKLITVLEENTSLQKENTRLKDQATSKSHQHPAVRASPGKLTS